jgi:anaerobic magnesium-protoporphyrin IX monomethyl ester cyclase
MATYVVGFGDEKLRDFYNSLKQLRLYDPDQIQLLYVTPHHWTPYFDEIKDAKVIQPDQRRWDYKHQVLALKHLRPWQVLLCVKAIEVLMQMRPKAIRRWLFHPEKRLRKAMFWYNNIGKRVWVHEIFQFFFREKRLRKGIPLVDFWEHSDKAHHARKTAPAPKHA